MAREFPRTRRIGEQIKRELAQMIRDQAGDPRFNMMSITVVDITRDLAYAKVYLTYLGKREERTEVVGKLNELAPTFRALLGRALHIRTVPKFTFVYDDSVERGADLTALIESAVENDRVRQQVHDDEAE